jgi:hypothetical protein
MRVCRFFRNLVFLYRYILCHIPEERILNITAVKTSKRHNYLIPWSWTFLEKQPVLARLKNLQYSFGTRRFITVFIRTLHWYLFYARLTHSIPPHSVSLSESDYSVLRSVARRRLVKTENPSACATVNWKMCRISIAL